MTMERLQALIASGSSQKRLNKYLLKHQDSLGALRNADGDTVLHVLVKHGKQHCLERLLANQALAHDLLPVRNHNGDTALQVASRNQNMDAVACLRDALMRIDLGAIKRLEPGKRNSSDPVILAAIERQFPCLSARHPSPSSGSSSSSRSDSLTDSSDGNSPRAGASTSSPELLDTVLEQFAHSSCDPENKERYATLTRYLVQLAQEQDFAKSSQLSELTTAHPSAFWQVSERIKAGIQMRHTAAQEERSRLLENLITLLTHNRWQDRQQPVTLPDLSRFDETKQQQLADIFLLCAGQSTAESGQDLVLETIDHSASGLQAMLGAHTVLKRVLTLYPHFDRSQKMVANYLLWRIMYCVSVDKRIPPFNPEPLMQANRDSLDEPLATKFNDLFQALIATRPNPVVLQNARLAGNNSGKTRLSFDKMVDQALSLPADARQYNITVIARELKLISIAFYQELSVSDFGADQDKSPHLSQQAAHFNQLSNYFVNKILRQEKGNVANALTFMLQLAHAMYETDNGSFTDLNGLMMISSVLENSSISRLSSFFETLSPEDRQLKQEIAMLTSYDQNFGNLRLLHSNLPASLPYPGLLKTDVYFALRGNKDLLSQAQIMGKAMIVVSSVKEQVYAILQEHDSDLPDFLKSTTQVDESLLDMASWQLENRVFKLVSTTTSLCTTLPLIKEALDNNLEATYMWQDTPHTVHELGPILLSCIEQALQKQEASRDSVDTRQRLYQMTRDLLIRLANTGKPPSGVTHNAVYLLKRLSQMREHICSPLPAPVERTATLRRTRSHSLFNTLSPLKRNDGESNSPPGTSSRKI